jgi:dTDP-4-dehydrorhamnose 3,5-epimerase
MKVIKTEISDLVIIEPIVFEDERGYFYESFNKTKFEKNNLFYNFVQDNQSKSSYGVIRGLHYQTEPYAQTKLVRVLDGKILDVVVDIRKNSPTFGMTYSIELSSENKKQLLVPKGFAHGFSVLSQTAVVFYKCDEFYNKTSENGIIYNDDYLSIDWKIPVQNQIISEKDAKLQKFTKLQNA